MRNGTDLLLWRALVLIAVSSALVLAAYASSAAVAEKSQVDRLPNVSRASDNAEPRSRSGPKEQLTDEQFVGMVIKDINYRLQSDVEHAGIRYSKAKVNAYKQSSVNTACGENSIKTGPMYCYKDETVYVPLNWVVDKSKKKLVQYGDPSLAIALAHEMGHHAQNLLGILDDKHEGELFSIQTELQADCFAGLWARAMYAENHVERSDIRDAMNLLEDLADNPKIAPLSPKAHGSAEKRLSWFDQGFDTGKYEECGKAVG